MRGMGTSKQINRDKDRELLCYLLDEIDTTPKNRETGLKEDYSGNTTLMVLLWNRNSICSTWASFGRVIQPASSWRGK